MIPPLRTSIRRPTPPTTHLHAGAGIRFPVTITTSPPLSCLGGCVPTTVVPKLAPRSPSPSGLGVVCCANAGLPGAARQTADKKIAAMPERRIRIAERQASKASSAPLRRRPGHCAISTTCRVERSSPALHEHDFDQALLVDLQSASPNRTKAHLRPLLVTVAGVMRTTCARYWTFGPFMWGATKPIKITP